jgi:hypothetical protein
MLREINKAIWVSGFTGRYLVIDCSFGAFSNDFGKYFHIPDFSYSTTTEVIRMDKNISEEQHVSLRARTGYDKTIKKYTINGTPITLSIREIMNNNDDIVYVTWVNDVRDDIPWRIRVNKNIVRYLARYSIDSPYVGVHFRNTDKKGDFGSMVDGISFYRDKARDVYLATDDHTAKDRLTETLGDDFNIVSFFKPFDNKGGNVHYGNPNKDEVILTSLVDMWMLVKSDYFVPSPTSSFSVRVDAIRKGDKFF